MNGSRQRVGAGGTIRIPPHLLRTFRISEGDEVDLKAEASKLVLIPVTSRKRIKLSAEIVDELVENEELFEAELT